MSRLTRAVDAVSAVAQVAGAVADAVTGDKEEKLQDGVASEVKQARVLCKFTHDDKEYQPNDIFEAAAHVIDELGDVVDAVEDAVAYVRKLIKD